MGRAASSRRGGLRGDARIGRLAWTRAARGAVVLAGALALAAPSHGSAVCTVAFRDAVGQAHAVLLVQYRDSGIGRPYLVVSEVLRGESDMQQLALGPHGLGDYRPRDGDRFVLAMTEDHRLMSSVSGLGLCTPISVLAVRRGKLRGAERANYDGGHAPLSLDELRSDLHAGAGARGAGPGPGSVVAAPLAGTPSLASDTRH